MKREQANREYLGLSKSDSLVAAVDAYEWVESHPEEAPFVLRSILFDLHTQDVRDNGEIVSKTVQSFIKDKVETLKPLVRKAAISKAANGGDIDHLDTVNEAIGVIAKAFDESSTKRDLHGRFSVVERRIKHNKNKKIGDTAAKLQKIPDVSLSKEQKQKYRQAYAQVSDILKQSDLFPSGTQVIGIYSDGSQTDPLGLTSVLNSHNDAEDSNSGVVVENKFKDSDLVKLQFVSSRGGNDFGYDLLASTGSSGAALAGANIVDQMNKKPSALSSFYQGMNPEVREQGTGTEFFSRLEASAKLADQLGGNNLSPNAKVAIQAAQFAGKHAPEAEKVIGPTARKSAYRYRGVEKTPNPVLQEYINANRDKYRKIAQAKGHSPSKGDSEARNAIIHGFTTDTTKSGNPAAGKGLPDHEESPIVEYFQNRLPSEDLYELNRRSGTIPPSQGVIIDRKGEIVTEAMGYGDDWYLPFNLKNLSKLQGGEYIRSRAYGGLTAEDIYAGLVSGARAVTVVSHSGVYTVEFDDDLRGTRRYSDKAARMVDRYEHLLDSLANGKINTARISPARSREIETAARRVFDPIDQDKLYKDYKEKLYARENLDPKLAATEETAIKEEVADRFASRIDRGFNLPPYKDHVEYAADMARKIGPDNQATSRLSTIDGVLSSLKATEAASEAIDRAGEELKMQRAPLRLNARGYKKAQDALQEQFPYYFSRVTYRPGKGEADHTNDKGYVKPRYNRPAGAKAGYHDESITGNPKVSADNTGYQNFEVRQRIKVKKEAEEKAQKEEAAAKAAKDAENTVGSPSAAKTSGFSKAKVYEQLANKLNSLNKFPVSSTLGAGFSIGIGSNGATATQSLSGANIDTTIEAGKGLSGETKLDALVELRRFKDPNLLKAQLANPDSTSAKKLFETVDKVMDSGLFPGVFSVEELKRFQSAKDGTIGAANEIAYNSNGTVKDSSIREMLLEDKDYDFGPEFTRTTDPAMKQSLAAPGIEIISRNNPSAVVDLDLANITLQTLGDEFREASIWTESIPRDRTMIDFNPENESNISSIGIPIFTLDGAGKLMLTESFKRSVVDVKKAKSALQFGKNLSDKKAKELQEQVNNGPDTFNIAVTNQDDMLKTIEDMKAKQDMHSYMIRQHPDLAAAIPENASFEDTDRIISEYIRNQNN